MQNVVPQIGGDAIEFLLGKSRQQFGISIIGQRIFRWLGLLASVEVNIGQLQRVRARYRSTVTLMLLIYMSSVCGVGTLNAKALNGPILGISRNMVARIRVPMPGLM